MLETVPFPYGAAVDKTGMTVAVDRTVTSLAAEEAPTLLPFAELIAPDEPDPVAAAVSV